MGLGFTGCDDGDVLTVLSPQRQERTFSARVFSDRKSVLSAIKFFPPGSIGFLIICAAIAVALMVSVRSLRRAMRGALAALALLYLLLSMPVTARGLAASLPQVGATDLTVVPPDAVMLLDGDNRRGRIRAVRAIELGSAPPPVIVLADPGDSWVVDHVLASGVPPSRVRSVTGATTTREQVALARKTMAATSWQRVAIVASVLQSPRVAALTRNWRPSPAIVSSPVDDEPSGNGLWSVVPSYIALRLSRDALYERAALMYYRWRGWI
jgi:uncharacterized SAM-binding protein YcdF (DUF218 family)